MAMGERRVSGLKGLAQAFDEVRFGASRTLNLRETLPTAAEAAKRAELWLRQQQVQKSDEVLIITGRGNNSHDGISVVREASIRVFHELRRKNVIKDFTEHTPGSFVIRLADVSAMFDAAPRRREHAPLPPPESPPTLAALREETRDALRMLAERSIDALGMKVREPFVQDEMLRLFGRLGGTVGAGADRERRLQSAIAAAMSEYD
jgi:hypothetical protein